MNGGKNKNPEEDKDDTDKRPIPRSPLTESYRERRKTNDKDTREKTDSDDD
jgi:hypothetical protein